MECIYTVNQKRIKVNSLNDPINIFYFGDVHRDTESCDVESWKDFLKEAKNTENSYFFYMGDGNDFASTKEKKIISDSGLHDTTRVAFDKLAMRELDQFYEEISFMKGRLLGCIEGNHSWVFKDGKKSDEIIAERMESPFLGWLCAYILMIDGPHSKSISVPMALCHGRAGGKRSGSSINQVEDMRITTFGNMIIYVMAHDHKLVAQPEISLVPVYSQPSWKMKQSEYWLCRSGTFKKGYEPDTSGYEIGRLLRPSKLGALRLQVSMERKHTQKYDVTMPKIKAII